MTKWRREHFEILKYFNLITENWRIIFSVVRKSLYHLLENKLTCYCFRIGFSRFEGSKVMRKVVCNYYWLHTCVSQSCTI